MHSGWDPTDLRVIIFSRNEIPLNWLKTTTKSIESDGEKKAVSSCFIFTSSVIWFSRSTSRCFRYRKLAQDFFRMYHSRESWSSSDRSLEVFSTSSFILLMKSWISARAWRRSLQCFIMEPTTNARGLTLVCHAETSESSIVRQGVEWPSRWVLQRYRGVLTLRVVYGALNTYLLYNPQALNVFFIFILNCSWSPLNYLINDLIYQHLWKVPTVNADLATRFGILLNVLKSRTRWKVNFERDAIPTGQIKLVNFLIR